MGYSSYQMVLMADGRLYVSTHGATSMTSLVFSAATSTANGGIVDIAMGYQYQYVLFGNGDLYGGTQGGTSMTRIATGVKMFDYDGMSHDGYVYIYDGNMIKGASAAGANTHTWNNLLSSNRTDIVQVRGATWSSSVGWGFLTSDGTLYTMEGYSNATTQWNGSNHTRSVTGVSYFDNGSLDTWAYLKSGTIYLWTSGTNSSYVTANKAPTACTGANSSGLTAPDLGGLPSISSSPPAKHLHFSKKKLIIN